MSRKDESSDLLVLATVNASLLQSIDANALLDCIEHPERIATWPGHLAAFFTEVPLEALDRYLAEHRLPPQRLLAAYRAMHKLTGERSETVEAWLGELAGTAA